MTYSSTWQAHQAKACADCWYCEHPPLGHSVLVHRSANRTRPRLGKAGRKALKRARVRERRKLQALGA